MVVRLMRAAWLRWRPGFGHLVLWPIVMAHSVGGTADVVHWGGAVVAGRCEPVRVVSHLTGYDAAAVRLGLVGYPVF